MRNEAAHIFAVFRAQGVHAGDFIPFLDFGDANSWESGVIRDETVGDAVKFLIDNGYVVERSRPIRTSESCGPGSRRPLLRRLVQPPTFRSQR